MSEKKLIFKYMVLVDHPIKFLLNEKKKTRSRNNFMPHLMKMNRKKV